MTDAEKAELKDATRKKRQQKKLRRRRKVQTYLILSHGDFPHFTGVEKY